MRQLSLVTGCLILLGFLFIASCTEDVSDAVCELAAFIEEEDGTNSRLIDSGRTAFEVKSCNEANEQECSDFVVKQVSEGTQGGNFSLATEHKDMYTVGDILCDKADAVEENIQHKHVQIYSRLCKGKWKKTSFRMPEPLCCDDGLYVPCKFKSN